MSDFKYGRTILYRKGPIISILTIVIMHTGRCKLFIRSGFGLIRGRFWVVTQGAQYQLMKEYTLNDIEIPNII